MISTDGIKDAYWRCKQPWKQDKLWQTLTREYEEFSCRPRCKYCREIKNTSDCPRYLYKAEAERRQEEVLEEMKADPAIRRRQEVEDRLKAILKQYKHEEADNEAS